MCLVALAWKCHPRWHLLLVGNRDEFHDRPTAALAPWPAPQTGVLAGRDLRSGGSWAGVNARGQLAVVTNVRDPRARLTGPSRGQLVAGFLAGATGAADYLDHLQPQASAYPPFNLVVADAGYCGYLGNHPIQRQELAPGLHGISNGPLAPAWPKTARLLDRLGDWIAGGSDGLAPLWSALADEQPAADAALPDTGIGIARERLLSATFIRGPQYGTRASTVVAIAGDGSGFICERRFGANGTPLGQTRIELAATGDR